MSVLHFVPGNIWYITQCCNGNQPLLKDAIDRRRWLYWLFQARRRFGLSVLNYVVLPTEVKLLVMDRRRGEIRSSLPFLANAMAKDYRIRHPHSTQLWNKDYQAIRLDMGLGGLGHCICDMDISIVRSKLAAHPNLWPECGYHELLHPPKRARRIDFTTLQRMLEPVDFLHLQVQREQWVHRALKMVASDAVYVPHTSVKSFAWSDRGLRPLSLPSPKAQNGLHQPTTLPGRELVPKR